MSDSLKAIYWSANIPHRYFDDVTPVDLYRGQKLSEFKQGMNILDPELTGWLRSDGIPRLAEQKYLKLWLLQKTQILEEPLPEFTLQLRRKTICHLIFSWSG